MVNSEHNRISQEFDLAGPPWLGSSQTLTGIPRLGLALGIIVGMDGSLR